MSTFFHRLFNFGVQEGMHFRLQNKIKIYNTASFSICLINFFYGIMGIVTGWYAATVVSFVSILLLIGGWRLIYLQKFQLTFHLVMVYSYCFLFTYCQLFGEATQSHLFFLFLPVAVTIMFEQRSTRIIYFIITILFLFATKLSFKYGKPFYELNDQLPYLFGYVNSAFAAFLIFVGVSLFKKENVLYYDKIDIQKQSIEEKNKEITDSINYAGRIQSAIIPSETEFCSFFNDAFVLLKPKDIVSGDFYWADQQGDLTFFAVADCTGHGVPGGFMTMLGLSFLDEIVKEKKEKDPGIILNALREKIISALRQTGTAGENKDGMDLVLSVWNKTEKKLVFAGANNSLYLLRNQELKEFKTNKQPCGFYHEPLPFTTHTIELKSGDKIYLFSDGFPDQFGGPKGKKFKYRQLEELLLGNHMLPMPEQKKQLEHAFLSWKGELDQVDDICVVGISCTA